MTEDFDKDIDSILRQAARQENFVSGDFKTHVDADEISMFSENALPATARLRVTEHLADCARCRKILSEVVLLNAESPAAETVVKTPEIVSVKPRVPWYKKLFASSSLAYSLGGLAVLLGGLLIFTGLQYSGQSDTASVAKVQSTPPLPAASGPSADESIVLPEAAANSNTSINTTGGISANSASSASNAAAQPNLLPLPSPSRDVRANANSAGISKPLPSPPASVRNAETAGLSAPAPVTPVKEDKETAAQTEAKNRAAKPQEQPQNYSAQTDSSSAMQSAGAAPRKVESLPRAASKAPQIPAEVSADAARETAVVVKRPSSPVKTLGGKTFTLNQGVWYDSQYNQQRTINVSRASDEYKKLDSGLRSIADSLGGTSVIVWQGKAYRIR